MKYRRDIDGLRAVAVIPVILFHGGFHAFGGGFVGVDVFFVISGYLITTIILAEKDRGSFSILNFYERRIRRILPALFLVVLATLPFAWLWLLPSDAQSYSQSLIAVATFSSNIFFWRTSGYWGIENELIPLLHTWSLAVEEQYYVIFPLFLMLVWRFRKRWIFSSFLVIALSSLLIAEWGSHHFPTANFFLLIPRFWELAIGASIAFLLLYRKAEIDRLLAPGLRREVLSLLGLGLITYAVFAFDATVPFPGVYALVPTLGTGLIILCSSPATVTGRLLGTRLLVGIGLISYSAYLWHQPLFAFARYRSLTAPGAGLILCLAALSLVLAYASWRFFERPFRARGVVSARAVFAFAAIGSAAIIAIGAAGAISGGWPSRMDARLQASMDAARLSPPIGELCLPRGERNYPNADSCTLVEGQGKFAMLLGDSHADAIAQELQRAFEQTSIGLMQATERGCPPAPGVRVYVSEADRPRCFEHNHQVFRFLQDASEVDVVIVVARWSFYASGARFDNGEGGVEPNEVLFFEAPDDAQSQVTSNADRAAGFQQAYASAIDALLEMGKTVVLVYPIPEAGWHVPRYVTSYYLSDPQRAFAAATGSIRVDAFRARNRQTYQALDAIGEDPNLVRVYPERLFCDRQVEGRCIVQDGESLLYSDDDHLSPAGARLLVEDIMSGVR